MFIHGSVGKPFKRRMPRKHLLFRCAILIGVLLSVLLLIETVDTYRYVERDLVREESLRESERHVSSIARAARLMRTTQSSDMGSLLREVARENPNQIAWVRVIARDGHIIATSDRGDEGPKYSGDELRTLLEQHRIREWKAASGPVLVVLRLLPRRSTDDLARSAGVGRAPEPEVIEVAMYINAISVNFGPLRQDLIVGIAAAFALLGTVIVIRVRFDDYVRAQQVEKELAAARQVQRDLFPAVGSGANHIEYAARCLPAWEVGGDLYDVFANDNAETVFVLGDVSGKGLSAALLMGLVQGAVRASCQKGSGLSPGDTAKQLNNLLCAKTARERFVTLFWCTFNAKTSILRYVNAGHCPPLLVRETSEVLRLEAGGPVLGMLPAAQYEYGEVMVQAGDLLVIFSDGIVEAADTQQQEFGEERLISGIEHNWRKPAREICNTIFANVNAFIGTQPAQDDQTLVIARFEPSHVQLIPLAEEEPVGAAQ
jgi:hypothetical protein